MLFLIPYVLTVFSGLQPLYPLYSRMFLAKISSTGPVDVFDMRNTATGGGGGERRVRRIYRRGEREGGERREREIEAND